MYNFIDHNIKPSFPTIGELDNMITDSKTVIILRPTLFFCTSQEIGLSKLKEYFTDYAITKLVGDGFIKFKDGA